MAASTEKKVRNGKGCYAELSLFCENTHKRAVVKEKRTEGVEPETSTSLPRNTIVE
jgi:hypothetical protein